MEKNNLTKKLAESSVMIALATVLSLFTLINMPYGGSVTPASMLPIVIVAYRYGAVAGLGSGFVFALIQQLLGLNNLSYVTGWQSVVAVILLDYVLAFTVIGLGGIFKGRVGMRDASPALRQSMELGLGTVLVCVLRYLFHTVAGATVWAGLSIPTEAALIYSLGYNATYMIPETIVCVMAALWLGSSLDFVKKIPVRFKAASADFAGQYAVPCRILYRVSLISCVIGVVADTLLVFPHLQNADDGSFTFALLSEVNWTAVIILSSVFAFVSLTSLIVAASLKKSAKA